MKVVFAVLLMVGVAAARPQLSSYKDAVIRSYNNVVDLFGYKYNVDTSDGFQKEEQGEIKNAGTDEESLAVTGSYSYVGDDGKTYSVKYTADENGFQPEGEHIPPSAGVKKPKVGIPPAAIASLAG